MSEFEIKEDQTDELEKTEMETEKAETAEAGMVNVEIPDPQVKDAGQRASVSDGKKVSYAQQDKYMRSVRGGMIMACAGPVWLIIQAVFGPSMYGRFGIRLTFEEYLTYNVNAFITHFGRENPRFQP